MGDIAKGLVPVFTCAGTETLRLDDLNTGDITLNAYIKHFFEFIPGHFHWRWSGATEESLKRYVSKTLRNFCDDYEKIIATQEMIFAFMREKELMEFFMRGMSSFEGFYLEEDFTYKLSTSYARLVHELANRFSSLELETKEVLKPFIDHINHLLGSEEFKQVEEFNRLFQLPMELIGYIGEVDDHNSARRKIDENKYYSPDSQTLYEVGKVRVKIHDITCTIIDGDKRIDPETLPQTMRKCFQHVLQTITYAHFAETFNCSVQNAVHKLVPLVDEPLQIIIRTEKSAKGKDLLAITLKEVPRGGYLKHIQEDPRSPSHYAFKVDELKEILPGKKRERTELQKKTIDRTITGESKMVYRVKTDYFHSPFFLKCQKMVDDLGKVILELRYLSFVSQQFCSMGKLGSITFPKLLPKEANTTEIIDAKNPTLVFENYEEGKPVVANTISITDDARVTLITGPNQNGKSRYIDTIAMDQIFCQAGWPVFAKEARMSPKTDLRVHYVHSGVGILGESRFSHECKRMEKVFSGMYGAYPLIIIDEPYTGTNPPDAEQLLKELLEACQKEGISLFLTTHFHNLIPFVDDLTGAQNLHCVIEEGRFTYRIEKGSSTISNALKVAESAGVRLNQLIATIQKIKNPPQEEEVVVLPGGADDDLPF